MEFLSNCKGVYGDRFAFVSPMTKFIAMMFGT